MANARVESPRTAPEPINDRIGSTTGSQQIIEHMTATLDEVHQYAFEKLTDLENKIIALKQSIIRQKNRSQQETQIYIETVDAALRTSEDLDRLVDDLERALPKEPTKTNGNGRLRINDHSASTSYPNGDAGGASVEDGAPPAYPRRKSASAAMS